MNIDPLFLGRLMPDVPGVPGMLLNWALPCTPYAGDGVGFYAIPPIGANVWIEFEGGDPNYPIWSGCFWEEGEMPINPAIPLVKVFKTDFLTLELDDTPGEGGVTLRAIAPVAPIETVLTFNEEGATLTCPPNSISMTPETIVCTTPEATMTMTAESIEIALPTTIISITGENISIETTTMEITAEVNVTGPVSIEGDVEITGAVEIQGDVEITGAVEIQGEVEITGAVEIQGNVNITGASELQGDMNVTGAVQIQGDLNVTGAEQVVGDFVVAGAMEGTLFGSVIPPF